MCNKLEGPGEMVSLHAEATLYFSNADTGNNLMRPEMCQLCKQNSCDRQLVLSYFDDNSNPESVGHRCCSFCDKICTCDSCAQNHSDKPIPDKDSAMTSTLNRTIQTKLYSYMETINNEIEDVCGCDGQMISGLTPSLMMIFPDIQMSLPHH